MGMFVNKRGEEKALFMLLEKSADNPRRPQSSFKVHMLKCSRVPLDVLESLEVGRGLRGPPPGAQYRRGPGSASRSASSAALW